MESVRERISRRFEGQSAGLLYRSADPDPEKLLFTHKCVNKFLRDMCMSYRAVTSAAGKRPENGEELCEDCLMRTAGKVTAVLHLKGLYKQIRPSFTCALLPGTHGMRKEQSK